ncbi:MAG TPA: YceI family protein [Acidimicrobiales bacterium]|jgi:polyisoprenoid-binding protein YceI|nr:YceI family protein [Acidimicrobiales bacterium]
MSKAWKWVIGVVVGVAVAIPVGTYVFIHFIEGPAPAKLTLDSNSPSKSGGATPAPAGTATGADTSGNWKPTPASVVGYRIKETLFGQSAEAVGRTSAVTGSMAFNGDTVSAVDLVVDMKSVKSDRSQRDGQFQGRIMNTAVYPTATFKLTQPLVLSNVPTDDTVVDAKATGDLTLHGVTRSVTFDLKAQRDGPDIKVNGAIPIVFADYDISNPSGGPATTADNGLLEFLVVFAPVT